MKKLRLFMPFVAMLLMSVNFVGCTDPKSEPIDPSTVDQTAGLTTAQMFQNVIGTYNGTLTEKTYYTNSTQTDEYTCYMKLGMDTQSNNFIKFIDAAYIYGASTWTTLTYPTGVYNITGSNNIYTLTYTLNTINPYKTFTVTAKGQITFTFYDYTDTGVRYVATFTGTK